MLSRANSDAGIRLRHAKSSPFVQYRPHGIADQYVNAEDAEVAAIEAFRRAHKQGHSLSQSQHSAKPHKRRNRTSQTSEGSHFEESRSGNRISNTRSRGHSTSASTKRLEPVAGLQTRASYNNGQEVINVQRRRAAAAATVPSEISEKHKSNRLTNPDRDHIRKVRSAYYEPPASQDDLTTSKNPCRSTYYPDTPYRTAIESREPCFSANGASSSISMRKPTPRELQTDENVKVAAWDAYLQDFHQRKLRVRKSFIAPIKKRLTRDVSLADEVSYDASVPPYNFAAESDDVFSLPVAAQTDIVQLAQPTKPSRTRVVSDSLKSRFQRLMSRSKRVRSALPTQCAESQRIHDSSNVDPNLGAPTDSGYTLSIPPTDSSFSDTSRTRKSSLRSSHSNDDCATVKSRVTSWTNSTGTGTERVSGQAGALSSIDETGMLVASDEQGSDSKREQGSFLGRALRLSLHRPSKMKLNRSSEDSQRLYDALCKQIQSPEEHTGTATETTINDDVVATDTVVKEYMPPRSDLVNSEDIPTTAVQHRPTVRSVIPDPGEESEESSAASRLPREPSIAAAGSSDRETRKTSWIDNSRRSLSSQKPSHTDHGSLAKRAVPSQNQIATRLSKSKNRWQSTLEGESAPCSRAMHYIMDDDDNPYKLRSVPTVPQDDYLPVAIRHNDIYGESSVAKAPRTLPKLRSEREEIMSPSVYSRTTGCRSTTPNEGLADHGAFITVTGREVKRYSFGSPTKSGEDDNYVVKHSHEWQNWLKTELRDFSATPGPERLNLTGQSEAITHTLESDHSETGHVRQPAQRSNSGEDLLNSSDEVAHRKAPTSARTRRPKLPTQRSSIMNERYPLVETGRPPSSDRSITHRRTELSSRQPSNTSTVLTNLKDPNRQTSRVTSPNDATISIDARPRIRERHSTAILNSSYRPSSFSTAEPDLCKEEKDGVATVKHKSTSDLRASYRSLRHLDRGSINVRRRRTNYLVEDDPTLRKISEGPYGSGTPTNKENSAPVSGTSMTTTDKLTVESDRPTRFASRPASSKGPSRAPNIMPAPAVVGGRDRGSPGQRMADDWLNSRKSVGRTSPAANLGSSPAFI